MTSGGDEHTISDSKKRPSIEEARRDWRVLDSPDFEIPEDVRLISHEKFTTCRDIEVDYIPPSGMVLYFRFFNKLFSLLYAFQLLRETNRQTVLILNGGGSLWLFVGLLNRFFMWRKRDVLCWDIFVEVDADWKRRLMSFALSTFRLNVLWSRPQIVPHANWLKLPEERFIFLPFKANHSKGPRYDLPIGGFVFAGGNGKRDYKALIDAVRDTNIPVVISSTAPEVRRQIDFLPNVIVLGAPEPAYAQLPAASTFVVVSMQHTGLKGGGEANFCNGMWHEKPVIAADSIAAMDYIVEGETGYVVPSGDSAALRRRILELWNDPEKVQRMGKAARKHVEENFTHKAFIRRLLRLALLVGYEKK